MSTYHPTLKHQSDLHQDEVHSQDSQWDSCDFTNSEQPSYHIYNHNRSSQLSVLYMQYVYCSALVYCTNTSIEIYIICFMAMLVGMQHLLCKATYCVIFIA